VITACPSCAARYRVDVAKLRPEGARLRCTRCETVFRVQPPEVAQATPSTPVAPQTEAPSPPPAAPPAAPATPTAQPDTRFAPAPTQQAAPPKVEVPRDPERLVLLAYPEEEGAKQIAHALGSWGLETILVYDGVEAILNIQRALPRAVVLDAALPKMFGFQVCELMKRNESLREIKVALIGAIHDQTRYRRPPEELYGADAYTERHELPEGLRSILEGFGLPVGSVGAQPVSPQATPAAAQAVPTAPPAPQEAAPQVVPTAPPAPQQAAPPQTPAAPAAPAPSPELEKAERLARIIVSDIVLYNQEKFDAAIQNGNVLEALASELAEGYALFAERVDPAVGEAQELLGKELLRIARSRGMNG
jgi:predicted Zn finger-like uncharacterized protein